MAFLKHVGKQGDKKVAILFRQVPGEDHMALVIYPELIPSAWHDSIMKVIESDIGQQSEELANALHRSILPDGRLTLETLHAERMIKKVKTSDVIVTPSSQAAIRLDELNKLLNEMKQGDDAIRKLAENDASRGLVDPSVKRAAEARYKDEQAGRVAQQAAQMSDNFSQPTQAPLQAPESSVLSDRQLAANMLAQAQRMESDAKSLIAEASRMKKEAEKMNPAVNVADSNLPPVEAPKKRGRPVGSTKAQVANAAE